MVAWASCSAIGRGWLVEVSGVRVESAHDLPGVAVGRRSCCDAGDVGVMFVRQDPGAPPGFFSAPVIRHDC